MRYFSHCLLWSVIVLFIYLKFIYLINLFIYLFKTKCFSIRGERNSHFKVKNKSDKGIKTIVHLPLAFGKNQ